jgi:hypothetical protein
VMSVDIIILPFLVCIIIYFSGVWDKSGVFEVDVLTFVAQHISIFGFIYLKYMLRLKCEMRWCCQTPFCHPGLA